MASTLLRGLTPKQDLSPAIIPIEVDGDGDSDTCHSSHTSSQMNELEDEMFMESIKSRLHSQWRSIMTVLSSKKAGHGSTMEKAVVPFAFLEPISKELGGPPAEQDGEMPLLKPPSLEVVDRSGDSVANSSPPSKDLFAGYPKGRRSKRSASSRKIALQSEKNNFSSHSILFQRYYYSILKSWGNNNESMFLPADDLSKERSACEDCRSCGEPLQELASKRPRIKDISACSLRKERERERDSAVAGQWHGSTFRPKVVKDGNLDLTERMFKRVGIEAVALLKLEKERCRSLEMKLKEAEKENIVLVGMIAEERKAAEQETQRLRMKLVDASNTIGKLLEKIKQLQGSHYQGAGIQCSTGLMK